MDAATNMVMSSVAAKWRPLCQDQKVTFWSRQLREVFSCIFVGSPYFGKLQT